MNLTCPHCGFSKEIEESRIPTSPMRVTCPQCRNSFSFTPNGGEDQNFRPAADIPEPSSQSAEPPQMSCPACGLRQPESNACAGCGLVFAKWEQRRRDMESNGILPLSERNSGIALSPEGLPKAGFWIRVVAALVDSVVVTIIQFVLGIILGIVAGIAGGQMSEQGEVMMGLVTGLFGTVLAVAYYVFFIGYCGQTPGKMAVRIKVIRTDGEGIGYGRAFLREVVGKFISGILLGIGYLMVAFDTQKQGLHDKIADTYVVKI